MTIASLAVSNTVFLFGFVAIFQVTPADVLRRTEMLGSEVRMMNETNREAISMNREEIIKLREMMRIRTEQLRRANEALLKLDPTFDVEEPE